MSLRDELIADEGNKKSAYQDSEGFWTIGVGRLIDARLGAGLSEDERQYLLTNSIATATAECKRLFPNFQSYSLSRQDGLITLMFNIGYEKIKGYNTFIAQVKAEDWAGVQENMRGWKKWRAQIGARADRITAKFGQ